MTGQEIVSEIQRLSDMDERLTKIMANDLVKPAFYVPRDLLIDCHNCVRACLAVMKDTDFSKGNARACVSVIK